MKRVVPFFMFQSVQWDLAGESQAQGHTLAALWEANMSLLASVSERQEDFSDITKGPRHLHGVFSSNPGTKPLRAAPLF